MPSKPGFNGIESINTKYFIEVTQIHPIFSEIPIETITATFFPDIAGKVKLYSSVPPPVKKDDN